MPSYSLRVLWPERGAPVQAPPSKQLQDAAFGGHVDLVRSLLASGVDVNVVNEAGNKPIHIAAYEGHVEVLRVLLEAGNSRFESKAVLFLCPLSCTSSLIHHIGLDVVGGFPVRLRPPSPSVSGVSILTISSWGACGGCGVPSRSCRVELSLYSFFGAPREGWLECEMGRLSVSFLCVCPLPQAPT